MLAISKACPRLKAGSQEALHHVFYMQNKIALFIKCPKSLAFSQMVSQEDVPDKVIEEVPGQCLVASLIST